MAPERAIDVERWRRSGWASGRRGNVLGYGHVEICWMVVPDGRRIATSRARRLWLGSWAEEGSRGRSASHGGGNRMLGWAGSWVLRVACCMKGVGHGEELMSNGR